MNFRITLIEFGYQLMKLQGLITPKYLVRLQFNAGKD